MMMNKIRERENRQIVFDMVGMQNIARIDLLILVKAIKFSNFIAFFVTCFNLK